MPLQAFSAYGTMEARSVSKMLKELLSPEQAIEYVKTKTDVFTPSENLHAYVLAGDSMSVDGLANQVLRVESKDRDFSVIVKQVLPFVRILKESGVHMPLDLNRMKADVLYMKVVEQLSPDTSIHVHSHDRENNILVMEDLRHMKILRYELIRGNKFPEFPGKMGAFLGRIAFLTSKYNLSHWEKDSFDQFFSDNYDDGIWKELVFDSLNWEINQRQANPLIEKELLEMSRKREIYFASRDLKAAFFNQHQSLIHTDLQSSNVFVAKDEMKIIDSEYARYGPSAYDLGQIMASLLLNYGSLIGHREWSVEKHYDFQAYLLESLKGIYQAFEDTYFTLWDQKSSKDAGEKDRRRRLIFRQTLGFMACASMQRIYEDVPCLDFLRIESQKERAVGQRFIIEIAQRLVLKRYDLENMDQVIKEIRATALHYK
jgi:5-methylthioribose kinase